MTKKIVFKAHNRVEFETQPRPFPAKQKIPRWFRDLPPYDISPEEETLGNRLILSDGVPNFSPKKCTPMLDSMTTGYILPLHSDVNITSSEDLPEISWRSMYEVFSLHGNSSTKIETPEGYYPQAFKFMSTWIPETPPGYSILVTSPLGYHDPVFRAIPAIIDTDKKINELLPPVWVKKGFDGVVEKGTPIVQIIPFKRDAWESEFEYYEPEDLDIHKQNSFFSTITNNYIRNIWSRKEFK
jgi:hypothetical protein